MDASLERYARFYVVEWVTSTNGGIIGAKVKFEPEWTPSKYLYSKNSLLAGLKTGKSDTSE
jgi:hypothetical protein